MYLVVIFGQIHTLHTLHTLHKGRGFWRVENSYPLPLPLLLPSKNPGSLDYPCHSLDMMISQLFLHWSGSSRGHSDSREGVKDDRTGHGRFQTSLSWSQSELVMNCKLDCKRLVFQFVAVPVWFFDYLNLFRTSYWVQPLHLWPEGGKLPTWPQPAEIWSYLLQDGSIHSTRPF